MLTVSLFGHLHLSQNGKDFPFAARPKVVPLLAYLLLHRAQPVSRDSVAFALWPDEPEKSARANLRRHLHYLRQALPPSPIPWLTTDARTVRWNPAASVRTDAGEFERCAADPTRLHEAIELYHELLAGCEDEWLLAERERYRRTYVQLLWDLARQARGRRDGAAAADYLGRILTDDPWREDAMRALMTVRCESGDRSSALQLCADFEQRLQREMGVAPMPETLALRHAIERDNPLPAVPLGPAQQDAATRAADLHFGGRDKEIASLRGLWEQALAGAGAVALVVSEAGIGKTRLISEFAVAAEAKGARVFWGTTSSPESVPYQPIAEILRAALGFLEPFNRDPYDLDVLSLVVPELPRKRRMPDPGGGPPAEKLFEVIAAIFVELSRQRPALFVLEDLHAAGQATIGMLEYIVQRCHTHPILVVATLREEEPFTAEALRRLRRPQGEIKPLMMALGPLSEAAARSIAAQSLGKAADINGIVARAGGHPLFLAQLVQAAESHSIDVLPTRLRELIDARTEPVSAPAGFVLRAAAVAGNAFDLEIVAETLGWSESQVAAAADELIAHRLIRLTARSRAFEYEFAHDLIASAVYESLQDRARRRLHRRTARACERWYASRLAELAAYLARHFELGGEREPAIVYYLRAAKNAANAFANAEALAHARRALDLRPSSPSDTFELLCLSEEVLGRIGDRTEQRAVLRRLERAARRLADPERVREALHRRETFHRFLAEYDVADRVLARLHRLATGDARWEAIALCGKAALLHNRASIGEAYAMAADAVDSAQSANDAAVLVEALSLKADYAGELDRLEDAERCLELAKAAAASSSSLILSMRVLYCELTVLGRFQAWSSIVERGPAVLELAAKVGSRVTVANTHTLLGAAGCCLFNFDDARHHLHRAIQLYRDCDLNSLFIAYFNLSTLEREVGRLENAESALDAMNELLGQSDNALHRAGTLLTASDLALERGEHTKAIDLGERAIKEAQARGDRFLEAAAHRIVGLSLRTRRELVTAVDRLKRAFGIFQRSGVGIYAKRAAADLALAYAMAGDARASSFVDEALRLRESDATDADSPSDWWVLSQALDALGRGDEAREALGRAHRSFQTWLKRLRNPLDRAAFSRLRDNAALERAYASLAENSPQPTASARSPRVRRGRKTRTSDPLQPPAHSP